MKNKKRIITIAGIHCTISFMILFAAIIMTAAGIPHYPKHIHPTWFVVLQRIINFPLILLMSYTTRLILVFLRMQLGMNLPFIHIVFLATLVAIPFNSFIWGISINKIINFFYENK